MLSALCSGICVDSELIWATFNGRWGLGCFGGKLSVPRAPSRETPQDVGYGKANPPWVRTQSRRTAHVRELL